MEKFNNTFAHKVIYVFTIDDDDHRGFVKIGEATLHTDGDYSKFPSNCKELNLAAKERIAEYTSTAGIRAKLLHTEIAVYKNKKGEIVGFRDHAVHNVLKRSGVKNKQFDALKKQNEWFECDLQTAIAAIEAVKNEETALPGYKVTKIYNPIIFRPEQEEAIEKTIEQFTFKNQNHMLWFAKMRFGKTLCALEVIKRLGFKKSIIITHRPDVDIGWFEDFNKIFYENDTAYRYGSDRGNGYKLQDLLKGNKPFVYFTSIQNLRGSIEVGGKYPKNDDVFTTDWDLVITDEAHEGTQTELGTQVREKLIKNNTKDLSLSGTPFNLFDQYSQDDTFTWDYISEQKAKNDWMRDPLKLGDSNPYEDLPRMNLYTYHLEKLLQNDAFMEDKSFNFKEFFRVWTGDKKKDGDKDIPAGKNKGDFVHEDAVKAFLDLLCKKDKDTNYPFSTDLYRDYFRHTLWMVPGVKEAKALSNLLKKHPVFGNGNFEIVNVAGEGDFDPDKERKALNQLRKKITNHPENTRTITLSCGRLTTGVTVKERTAVLMLAGSYITDAKQYLQTIFRVQSPATINGKVKQNCYVFDFAPDRALRVVYDSVKKMSQRRNPPVPTIKLMSEFLNFCPVISFEDSKMKTFRAEQLIQEIKRVYTERVVDSGFEDAKLYNDELLKLDNIELEKFENLKRIVGKTAPSKKPTDVNVASGGYTGESDGNNEKKGEKNQKKNNKSEEEQKRQEQRATAISILRGISIRIPLLVYGIDKEFDYDISIEDFCDLVDSESWNEFMPKGVTKEIFKDFIKYYDKDIFVSACRKIRMISKNADDLEPTERVKAIANLFSKFKNPDKETVLTPRRVVNLHMSETIGGYDFWDEEYEEEIEDPRFVNQEDMTSKIFDDPNSKVLEINSKTGLYPLYVTYTYYRISCKKYDQNELTFEKKQSIWDEVVRDKIYVICKTKMAKLITQRTLLGYRNGKINAHAFDDLINQLRFKQQQFLDKVTSCSFWNKEGNKMEFSAVVGNPPYQTENNNNSRKEPVYQYFYDAAFKISKLVTLISPGRFLFNAGQTSSEWNNRMLSDEHIRVAKYFKNSQDVFSNVTIKGGIVIIVRDLYHTFQPIGVFDTNDESKTIISKILSHNEFTSLRTISFPKSNFGLSNILYMEHPEFKNRLTKGNEYILDAKIFEKIPEIFFDKIPNDGLDYLRVLGREDGVRVYKYCLKKYIKENQQINCYKVFVAGANGEGKMGEKLKDPVVGLPGDCSTQTFMSFGLFDSLEEATNCVKYMKTKFLRFCLGTLKKTQNNPGKTRANVPLLNFKNNSEINWDMSIDEIDEMLFKKFNLSSSDITWIKENIMPND